MIYLASPYSADPVFLHAEALRITGALIRRGHCVYSPIVHCHPIHQLEGMPQGFDFWKKHNYATLAVASELWVALLNGWTESTGVNAEIRFALQCGKQVKAVDPLTCTLNKRAYEQLISHINFLIQE